jgi:Protein of unknown function (DUF1549)/Protein of unknown function (DUF1553)/Planctomycete cytochrome C
MAVLAGARACAEGFAPEALEFFEKSVRPVLVDRCYSCHSRSAEKLKGNLFLDTREGALKGGDTGPAVTPGDLGRSLLIAAIARTNQDLAMPPKTALPDAERDILRRWVAMGAPWSQDPKATGAAAGGFDIQGRKAAHWCWKAPTAAPLPAVRDKAWGRSGIDAWILSRLEGAGLKPAAPADRRTLIRRATFDLTGLPPTPAEVDAFVNDPSPDAFAAVVDRLLGSPHFGERWARHWMDLVRYAESRGHEFDPDIPNAWRYRDYLVRAYNADLPYDQFVREHLAGDLIPPRHGADGESNESILGTAFWFLGEEAHSPVDIRQDEADRIDNRLDVMGKTFLGLTLGCARCHDHKFDPISQRDYYAMTGFLVSASYRQARFESLEHNRRIAEALEARSSSDGSRLAQAAAGALRAPAGRLERTLTAAAEVLGGNPVEDAAARHDAVVAEVIALRNALGAARKASGHPLHRLATLASGAAVQATAARMDAQGSAGVIVDFARVKPEEWIQDGSTFGLRPLRAGELIPGPDAAHPLFGVSTRGAAVRGPIWRGMHAATDSRDYGVLGNWDRAEQTLKTREFRLGAPALWYLVKGSGRAYAVVDSHLMVNGPLHGALLLEWRAPAEGWAWVKHPLGDYAGHRLHVEFSPAGDDDLQLARVVEAEAQPPLPGDVARPAHPGTLAGVAEESRRVAEAAGEVIRAWAAGRAPEGLEAAAVADWMAGSFDELCPAGSRERRAFDSSTGPVFREREKLSASIRRTSPSAPAMFDGSGMDEVVLGRGSAKRPGALALRRFLEAIDGPEPMHIASGGGRLQLADAVLKPENPLTARVMVNRVWRHLFGVGLSPTVDNFGVLGQPPTHPELLDALALRFRGPLHWSVKGLIREMMLSNAYQMASAAADAAAETADPENKLLHRMNLRRLEAEAIRDEILAVTGGLNPSAGGPSVPVYLTSFMDGRGRPTSGPLDGEGRRSLYISVRRNFLSPMMLAFDAPIPFNTVGRRNLSNVPAQALTLMNDPFVTSQAAAWAKRLPAEPAEARVRRLFETAFGRPPSDGETAKMTAFASAQAERLGAGDASDPRVWADVCHVLFNLKEFVYLN